MTQSDFAALDDEKQNSIITEKKRRSITKKYSRMYTQLMIMAFFGDV